MNENDVLNTEYKDKTVSILIIEAICVLIVILTILIVKYLFPSCYQDVKAWYDNNICVQTDVNEVLQSLDGDVDEV